MERIQCSVQSKIPCMLKTVIKEIPSSKRSGQNYRIIATDNLSQEALDCEVEFAIATEKFDGTCCHVRFHQGKPALWARLDRKPSKNAEKRFRIFQKKLRESLLKNAEEKIIFDWKYPDDFRNVPEFWIPADGVTVDSSSKQPVPDATGHIPGWVPVDETNKQYCWHSSTVHYTNEAALVIRPVTTDSSISSTEEQNLLKVYPVPLLKLVGKTLELIGTNINGNPYNLGNKAEPFHVLIEHGCIPVVGLRGKLTSETICSWFESSEFASIEGIVWHCKNGKLFKLHRHHLNLPWPLRNNQGDGKTNATPLLCNKPVVFDKNNMRIEEDISPKSMFRFLKKMDGKSFDNFSHIFENTS